MGNNQLAKDFCMLVDRIKNGRHLNERIEVNKVPDKPIKIVKKPTNFMAEVSKL